MMINHEVEVLIQEAKALIEIVVIVKIRKVVVIQVYYVVKVETIDIWLEQLIVVVVVVEREEEVVVLILIIFKVKSLSLPRVEKIQHYKKWTYTMYTARS